MTAHCRFDTKSLELFSRQFHPITLTPKEIAQNWLNIVSIVTERHPSTRFVLLLLPERPYHYAHHSPYAFLQGKEQNHRDINNALRNAFRNKKLCICLISTNTSNRNPTISTILITIPNLSIITLQKN